MRAYYDDHDPGPHTSKTARRKVATKTARRKVANKLVGILHGCLAHGTLYEEEIAWGHPVEELAA